MSDEELFTTSRVAHLLQCSEHTVRSKADRGEIPCVRTSTGARLFRLADIQRTARQRGDREQRLTERLNEAAKGR
jgi:excisionase family DNA binding protein